MSGHIRSGHFKCNIFNNFKTQELLRRRIYIVLYEIDIVAPLLFVPPNQSDGKWWIGIVEIYSIFFCKLLDVCRGIFNLRTEFSHLVLHYIAEKIKYNKTSRDGDFLANSRPDLEIE